VDENPEAVIWLATISKAFQQPPEETLCCFGIPPRLNEDVEHNAILIHGAPQIVLNSLDPDEHFVEVFVSWPGPVAAKTAPAKIWPNFLHQRQIVSLGSDNASFN
jgi:hypothetical protein